MLLPLRTNTSPYRTRLDSNRGRTSWQLDPWRFRISQLLLLLAWWKGSGNVKYTRCQPAKCVWSQKLQKCNIRFLHGAVIVMTTVFRKTLVSNFQKSLQILKNWYFQYEKTAVSIYVDMERITPLQQNEPWTCLSLFISTRPHACCANFRFGIFGSNLTTSLIPK